MYIKYWNFKEIIQRHFWKNFTFVWALYVHVHIHWAIIQELLRGTHILVIYYRHKAFQKDIFFSYLGVLKTSKLRYRYCPRPQHFLIYTAKRHSEYLKTYSVTSFFVLRIIILLIISPCPFCTPLSPPFLPFLLFSIHSCVHTTAHSVTLWL